MTYGDVLVSFLVELIGGGMNAISKQSGFTRLRDFGAFQPDISRLPTDKTVVVKPGPERKTPPILARRLTISRRLVGIGPTVTSTGPSVVVTGSVVSVTERANPTTGLVFATPVRVVEAARVVSSGETSIGARLADRADPPTRWITSVPTAETIPYGPPGEVRVGIPLTVSPLGIASPFSFAPTSVPAVNWTALRKGL